MFGSCNLTEYYSTYLFFYQLKEVLVLSKMNLAFTDPPVVVLAISD